MNAVEGLRDFERERREIRALDSADNLVLLTKEDKVLERMIDISETKTTTE
jgi:hypothetical protein